MDRWQAIYRFWASFGLPAYEENSIPEDAKMPYITFESSVGGFEAIITLSASIWDRTTKGTAFIDAKADEIQHKIKTMGCPEIAGGRYRVFVDDSIFAQNMNDPEDRLIKKKVLQVNFEFMANI